MSTQLSTSSVNIISIALDPSATGYNGKSNKICPVWQITPIVDNDQQLTNLTATNSGIDLTGDAQLQSNQNQDSLLGGAGSDYLVGNQGNDSLFGGAGADIFAVQRHTGLDTVQDFTDGQDKLVLLDGIQFNQLCIQQQGNDTLISFEGNALMMLKNLNATLLTSADIVSSVL